MGPRRAAVLIGVHILLGAHIAHWYFTGKKPTVSPIEPSEAMHTINDGVLNAGFIFFALALLATALLGRFFCGWGCHVVALQDLCGWAMKKIGIHPKPFRARLLAWVPLGIALYMFVWPTFSREVVKPLAGQHWATIVPYLGEPPPRPQLRVELLKANFWETFATWTIAIPFLAVCGFATVYFLGAKGFCFYGCPYGGFFTPLDRIAPTRIRVTDACEHCGHCTAVCTSNVRVHEEVRDYGMVVDPGCMKCMDCVSVCPNDALYVGLGRPALLAPKKPDAKPRPKRLDLSWPEELGVAAVFLALFLGFRGMLGLVPLLMAVGMAGIGAYLAWKLYAMLREPSVRIQNLQLKLKGRLRPAGAVVGIATLCTLALGAWGLYIFYHVQRADVYLYKVNDPTARVFAPNYKPDDATRAAAEAALHSLRISDSPKYGGRGWQPKQQNVSSMAYLQGVLGDYEGARNSMRRVVAMSGEFGPGPEIVMGLGATIGAVGGTPQQGIDLYKEVLEIRPRMTDARFALARLYFSTLRQEEGLAQLTRATEDRPDHPHTLVTAARFLINVDRVDLAEPLYARAVELEPANAGLQIFHGKLLANLGREEEALARLQAAEKLQPDNIDLLGGIAVLLNALNRPQDAAAYQKRIEELSTAPR